jgi:hypothetical protein
MTPGRLGGPLATVEPAPAAAAAAGRPATRLLWPAHLTVAGIALVPVQLAAGSLSVRVAPSDVLFAAAAVLLLAADRAPARRLLLLWLVLFAVVTWAVVVGSGRGTVLPSALLDRWVGCVALLAAAFATSVLEVERIGRGLRAASWVSLATHVAVAVWPSIAGSGGITGRNAGFLVDPNNAGVMVACLLTIELARAVDSLRTGSRVGWPTALLIAGLTWAIVETGSRTGWSALAAGILTLLVVNRDRLLVIVHRRILRFLAGTVVLVLALQTTLEDHVRSLQSRPDNIARRSEVLTQSWASFTGNPLAGGGLLHTMELGIGFPHNSLLWLLGDAGIAGLIAFLVIVIAPICWLLATPSRGAAPALRRPVLCGLVAMTVSSVGIEALYQRQWWVLIGAAAAVSIVRRPPPGGRTRITKAAVVVGAR